jgi:GNAT superfamily N-acetyltransferase
MPMRPIRLPGDLLPLIDMAVRAFQYPENPEWSIQRDEQEDIAREIRNLRQIWPVLRVLRLFSPALRDLFRGFIWEEAGEIVGVVLCQRQGTTNSWGVSIVGVLPEYRGRGIARQLLMRSLEDLRERGADKAVLGVIDRNVPAYSLYTSLGFEQYTGSVELEIFPDGSPEVPALPGGYVQEPVKRSGSWRVRYELDRRITPPDLTRYEPVVLGRYRPPFLLRPLLPVMHLLQRREEKPILVRRRAGGELVAWARYDVPRRPGGVNQIRIRLDPRHPQLAEYLVAYHLERVAARGSGRRADFIVPNWMTPVIEAAERYGFTRRLEYHHLGLAL